MWRPWGNKSTVRIHSSSSPSPSPSASSSSSPSLFSCSSFKDIQSLCLDDSEPQPQPQHQHRQPLPTNSPTKKPSVFHRVRLANSLLRTWSTHHQQQPPKLPRSQSQPEDDPTTPFLPGADQRVVVYFTSLRVVRPTFEACKAVLSILHGFRVPLDERDVSMDSAFLTELNRVMGRPGLTLPRVFISGRYVGGVEEVTKMNETGELKKVLGGLPKAEAGDCCHVCGGHRFILCDECDGSRKVYTEKGGFRTCGNCNENGLLRCPSCFTAPILS